MKRVKLNHGDGGGVYTHVLFKRNRTAWVGRNADTTRLMPLSLLGAPKTLLSSSSTSVPTKDTGKWILLVIHRVPPVTLHVPTSN